LPPFHPTGRCAHDSGSWLATDEARASDRSHAASPAGGARHHFKSRSCSRGRLDGEEVGEAREGAGGDGGASAGMDAARLDRGRAAATPGRRRRPGRAAAAAPHAQAARQREATVPGRPRDRPRSYCGAPTRRRVSDSD
jgi:hypothetical protein